MEQKIRVGKFTSPDEQRKFGQGHMDVLKLGSATIGRGVFEPGWRWSNDVKPITKTKSCEVSHTIFVVSGRMHVEMDEGEAIDIEPGDCAVIPPGHDAWTLGDTACVALDFTGAASYATGTREARTGATGSEPRPGAH
jgi:mannose-6-phosphate isomerase-like protein (cupin superfamily)